MSNISNDLVNSNDEYGLAKESKKRISYVSKDHKSMIEFVSEVYKYLGHIDYHTNKAIATIHGLSPDSIKQHLTSAQQYKLLEIKHGVGYKITELFKRIFLPINDVEQKSAIIESLKSPDTYAPLFKEYEFHIVPPVSGIKNHFVRNYQFKEDIAEKSAEIFIENLKEYDLLDQRGVLISALPIKPKAAEIVIEELAAIKQEPIIPTIQKTIQSNIENDDLFELPIPLPNKRKAYLKYPLGDLTKKDITVIAKALDFIASSLDDE